MNIPKISETFHRRLLIGLAVFVLLAIYIAYKPVLFGYFCSDDFYIVSWLHECKRNIPLLFQTVYEGTPYYRPLLNLLLLIEYFICGPNGQWFRFFGLAYLLLAAFIIWQLVSLFMTELSQIDEQLKDKGRLKVVNLCSFSAALFALYPLHTEPINWLVGTTELLANVFILASFLFFLYWTKRKRLVLKLASLAFTICAFLTKEIAVILPALIFIYSFYSYFISAEHNDAASSSNLKQNAGSIQKKLKHGSLFALKASVAYWLLLVIYLCLRKTMTGEFLGNWNNNVFHFADNRMMLQSWWQSLKVILVPLSAAVFGESKILSIAWLLMLFDLIFLTISAARKSAKILYFVIFLLTWFFLSLVPMAKLLLITPNLLDARYGYIASVPLCILLMLGLALAESPKGMKYLKYLIFTVVITFCAFVLRGNNSVWAEAGRLTNAMVDNFRELQKKCGKDKIFYFINIPVQYKGVPIAGLKSIDSMNHIPFADNNYNNCFWLLGEDQSIPLAPLIEQISETNADICFYYLDIKEQHFVPIQIRKFDPAPEKINLGIPQIIPGKAKCFIYSPEQMNCANCDALVIKGCIESKIDKPSSRHAKLTFENDIEPIREENLLVFAPIKNTSKEQTFIFNLRGKPAWTLGGMCKSIKILFPKNLDVKITDAYGVSFAKHMPSLIFKSDNFDPHAVQFNLSKGNKAIIAYNASFIENCAGVKLEIIEDAQRFSELNSAASDVHSLRDFTIMKPTGQLTLNWSSLPKGCSYKVRFCPVNKYGEQCAFCSDHFIIRVKE